ncbi:MAG TPA: sensor histidine kinase N-terminal domain-containing protein [Aliidongia sp.]|uniref:sensor histidine kinase n=1 Tax=Aliidongia sp. TaxID=1914230 RepID=UPI002DDDBB0A|nr:sensor histidine kinase N-terminal domain-containing protein [Aliidongia sp.]HEV2678391.1 sensor histidine kinase N-terminal domain-containing protein [Aliidongia sp.]
MFNKSLHLQILRWLLTPLVFLVLFNAWQGYSDARLVAGIVTDRTLVGSAHAIAEQIKVTDGVVEAIIPPSALEMFASAYQDRAIYRIIDSDGTLLAGYSDVPGPGRMVEGLEPQYFTATFRGQPIRAVALRQPLIGVGEHRFALVIVGQTLHAYQQMIDDLWIDEVKRQFFLVVIAAALTWFGLNRGLAPLARISDEIAQRAPDTLELIAIERVQMELRPLVSALNQSVERVRSQIDVQRRFITDAAHQLRTPLTLLKTQISYGLGEAQADEKDRSLAAMKDGIDQMVHLTNQLLTLAKVEPGAQVLTREPVDLIAITRHVLEEVADRALAKHIGLSFDVETDQATILGSGAMLHELVMNIVDNAMSYGQDGGAIAVSICRREKLAVLRVQDDGPGVPVAERERVFDRFYRILGTDTEGSGLGLSIVREIADRHGGTVVLLDSPSGGGLLVEVTLPEGEE